jgi:hypothetical protein
LRRPSELARWRAEREFEPDEDHAPRPAPGKTTRIAVEMAELWDDYVWAPVSRPAPAQRPAQAYGHGPIAECGPCSGPD